MHIYQHLIGLALPLSIPLYILVKRRHRSLPLKILIFFSLTTTIKEVFCFFSLTAPSQDWSARFFAIMVMFARLGYPLYLLAFISIPEKRDTKILLLTTLPALVDIAVVIQPGYLTNFFFFPTQSGWTYRTTQINLLLATDSILYFGYMAAIIIGLIALIRRTSFPLLRRKYVIFLASYIGFEVLGVFLTNALISLGLLSPIFQLSGIFHFLTFLLILYALSLKEKEIPLPIMGKKLSQVYSSFLTKYYNYVVNNQLGEGQFEFTSFIIESKIQDNVSIQADEIVFDEPEDLDLVKLIDTNLRIFVEHHTSSQVTDYYLRVLNAASERIGWKLQSVVKWNEDFLKESDLIYGISRGEFLKEIVEDQTLKDLDDVDACLKIYKRILMPIIRKILVDTKFWEKISDHSVGEVMKISDYGEVSIEGALKRIREAPEDQQVSLLIGKFNSFLSWVYERLLMDPDADVEPILDKLKMVLKLNREKADALGVYPTLLGMLATKIPKTQIHRLYSDYLEELIQERTRELEETQNQLLESQRLAAIGEVTAMVGHDLRNPLQSIVNMMYLTKEKLNSAPFQGSELLELAETVEEQVRYMNKIVSDLEDFARPLKVEFAPTDLHKLINDSISSIRVPDSVKVSIVIEDDLDFPKLTVDTALMKRVFINLITNALQAMPDGGDLQIAAKRMEDSALVSIQDTGVGIPEENMDKIFQPLFSTKAKGQGLGLSVCKRLVEAHDGNITFKSKAGKGSTFTVELPLQYMTGNQKETKIIARAA